MKKLLIFISLVIISSLTALTPTHATAGEQIDKYNSQVTIAHDNIVKVTETITYNFGGNSHHGIYRDIPIDYHDTKTKDTYYTNFKLNSVQDELGSPLQTQLSTTNGTERIRIGDPNVTINGIHTYRISYELSPLIIQIGSKPFLNLDIIGNGWAVPIYDITASVTLEGNTQLSNVTWYGADNSAVNANELLASYVAPYQGITINASLPDNYISNYLQPNKMRLQDILLRIGVILFAVLVLIILLAIVAIVIARRSRSRARRKKQTVVAQYEPPEGLTPAHIGLLEDDVMAGQEITATIIDWAVHGYLKIVYIPKKGFFSAKDYQFVQLKSPSDLPEWEQPLFVAFFSNEKEIKLSDLTQTHKKTISDEVYVFKKGIKKQLEDKGYYDEKGSLVMRGTITEEGAKEWALVDGFKLYLRIAEKDRLNFSDAPDKTPERFNALLPHAIALGVEKEWAKQFEGIDLQQTTNWYSGNLVAFSAYSLATDLGSSLSPALASSGTVSSSGGGGGGGFGGGGGGSW
jgi:uncharacterized membrane protein